MLSVLHVAPDPLDLSRSHRSSMCSVFGKHATITSVLADASNSSAPNPLPVGICHLKGVDTLAINARRLPLLTRPASVCNFAEDTGNDDIATADTSTSPATSFFGLALDAHPCSLFPVYGPFDLLHCLQTGGFGSAWAARDHSTGKIMCLKVFQSVQNPDISRSVRTELAAFRRIVKSQRGERGKQFVMELNRSMQHGVDVFFAMELMSTDLGSYFDAEPERCKLHARRWMAQIALGIQSLHEMSIIHRDIKTENMLIDSRENIRIIDFGLTHLGGAGRPLYAVEFLGTPPYMAPELLRNKGLPPNRRMPYGIAVDWWGLGCILYELESQDHQLLFDAEEDVDAYIVWNQEPENFEETYPRFEDLDPVLVSLLEGLLQVQPSIRFLLRDMEKHAYFLCRDGTTEFDNAAARARERRVRPELVPQFTVDHPTIAVIEAAKTVTPNDWSNMKWALVDI